MAGRPTVDRIPAIFFLSDYGTADEFVGVVHAVIHRLAPGVPVIDLSHQIPVFDVAAGADMLVRCAPSLGPGAVVAVVDPGVGTGRRAVAVRLGGLGGPLGKPLGAGDGFPGGPPWLVGPDNGLLLPVAARLGGVQDAWELGDGRRGQRRGESRPPATDADRPARTFDGRDVFAPAAAHLVLGGDPAAVGTPLDPARLIRLPGPGSAASQPGQPGQPRSSGPGPRSAVSAPVSWIDRFGNVQLRLTGPALEAVGVVVGSRAAVTLPGHRSGTRAGAPGAAPVEARRVGAFGELDVGELGLMVDANGQVALVLDRASAARHLGLDGTGGQVTIDAVGPGAG